MMFQALTFQPTLSQSNQATLTHELLARHLLVLGQTGSGKTTTTLSLLSALQHHNQATIVLDPTGEYTKLPNCISYRLGDNCYLAPGELSAGELLSMLGISPDLTSTVDEAIKDLQIQRNVIQQPGVYHRRGQTVVRHRHQLYQLGRWARDYSVKDLFTQLIEEFVVPYPDGRADYTRLGQEYDRMTINRQWPKLVLLQDRLASPAFQTLFDTQAHPGKVKTELNFVLKMFLNQPSAHRTLVLDLSPLKEYEESQRLVISLLLKTILTQRLDRSAQFPVNIVIDEAHRYLPQTDQELTTNGIFQLLREGRKGQLRMILTTQSPLDLPSRLRSQFSNLLIHRLTNKQEVRSVSTRLRLTETQQLPVGSAYLQVGAGTPNLVHVNLPEWW